MVLMYIACGVIAALLNLGIGVLWNHLRKRRLRGKNQSSFAKRAIGQSIKGAALLTMEALLVLGVFFYIGYYPALNKIAPLICPDQRDREERNGETISYYNLVAQYRPMNSAQPHDYKSRLYQQAGNKLKETFADLPQAEIEHLFYPFCEEYEMDLLERANESFRKKEILEPTTATTTKRIPPLGLFIYRFGSTLSNIINDWNFGLTQKISPAELEIPDLSVKQQILDLFSREYEWLYPVALRQLIPIEQEIYWREYIEENEIVDTTVEEMDMNNSEPLYYIVAWGDKEVKELQQSENEDKYDIYYIYRIGSYSMLSYVLTGTFYIEDAKTDENAQDYCFNIDEWTTGVYIIYPILLTLFLITQIFAVSRHERNLLKQQNDLFYAVAHELKTPMGVVMLHGEKVLESETAEAKNQRTLGMIEEIKNMNQRLMDVLAQSKLEGGRQQVKRELVSLLALAEEVTEGYEPLAEDKNLAMEVAGEDVRLYADGYLLKYAISNYLSNAIKHCPEGGQIKIGVQKKKRNAVLTVWNEGAHIPQGSISSIWDPFAKVGDGGDNAKKGSGLGLSIVRSIVALHGGSCGVRNTPDGVEFWCGFPMRKGKKNLTHRK